MNRLTDLETLPILLLILFSGMLTVSLRMFPDQAQKRYAALYLPRLDKFSLCVAQVHTSSISLSVLSLWALGTAALLWSGFYQLGCYRQLTNALSLHVSTGAVFFLNIVHDVIQPTVVCHHSFASTVCRNSCERTASPNKLPLFDRTAQQCWLVR